jgi:hypothetical protein
MIFPPSQWLSPSALFSSTNKTDCHDITEILLKEVLNTMGKKEDIMQW